MGRYQSSPLMFILGFVGTAIVVLIVAAPVALGISVAAGIWYVVKQKRNEQPAVNVQAGSHEKVAATRFIEEAGGYRAEYEGAYRQHVDLNFAGVDVWVYPRMGITRRTVRVKDAALVEKFGRRVKLEDVTIKGTNVQEIVEATTREVRNLLAPNTALPTESVTKQIESSSDRRDKARAKAHKQEREQRQQLRPKAKARASYSGEVIRYGLEEKDGRKGPYMTFCLHILDSEAGAPHQLSGVDLERAIKEAGVAPGDQVVVESLGRASITLDDGSAGYKNLWNVRKA